MSEVSQNLLSIKTVAEELSVHPKTVTVWLRAGVLQGVKAGRLWRVPRSELERYLLRHREQGQSFHARG